MKLLPLLLLAFVLSLGVACSSEAPDYSPLAPLAFPTPRPTPVPTPIPMPTATLTAPQATAVKQRHEAYQATETAVLELRLAFKQKHEAQRATYAPTATAIAYATAYAQYEKDLKVYQTAVAAETAVASTAKNKGLVIRELDYWEETNPLIEFAVIEGGTPLGKVIRQVQPGLMSGNQKDWETFIAAVKIALPVYQRALNDWLEIQPPSAGKSPALHRAYASAWAKRIESLQAMAVGWSNGDDDLVLSGYNSMGEAGPLAQRAESLRAEFNTYLYEQCNKHKYKECN